MKTSREQARGEGNCARATERGEEACECRGKRPVCRLPSVRHSLLEYILTESARLRAETSYNAGSVGQVSQTSLSRVTPMPGTRSRVTPMPGTRSRVTPMPGTVVVFERLTEASYRARDKSQRSLAHGQDDRKWCWNDERLVSGSRSLESQDIMGRACSSSFNHRVRIRMSGGVGRVPRDAHPYPISLSSFVGVSVSIYTTNSIGWLSCGVNASGSNPFLSR